MREDHERRRMVESLGAESMRDRRSLVPVVPSSDTGETPAPKTALELVTQQTEERHRVAHDLFTGRLVLDSTLTPVLSPAALKQGSPGVVAGGGDDINQGNKVPSM